MNFIPISRRTLTVVLSSIVCIIILLLIFMFTGGKEKTTDTGQSAMNAGQQTDTVRVVSSILTSPDTIEVTFDGRLDPFKPGDISITKALGTWHSLNPLLTGTIPIISATTRENERKQTVAVLKIDQKLNADATFTREEVIVPGKPPYFTAAYYSGNRQHDIEQANRLLTWQIEHGGWFKNMAKQYEQPWDGKAPRSEWRSKTGVELGTIDNDGTTNELLFMAVMYKETGDIRYKESALKAIDFLLKLQYPSGGWAQVYPARGNYSDYVTFNDNVMMRVMNVLTMIATRKYPFNSDVVSDPLRKTISRSIDRGVEYILKSQIVVNGKRTAWCAQHDPVTYEPRQGRTYEFPSISGSESVGIVQYLMSLPNPSEQVKQAIEGALSWLEEARVKGTKFVPADPNNAYFVADPNSSVWYRFYEIGTNLPIFSGRESEIKHNLLEIEKERRDGYAWAGTWPEKLLGIAKTTGYFENRVYVRVTGSESRDASGRTLQQGQISRITAPNRSSNKNPKEEKQLVKSIPSDRGH